MAEEYEAQATSSKRVRLSSEAQNELVEQKQKLQCLNDEIMPAKQEPKEKGPIFSEETFGEPVDPREQYGDLSDYELLEKLDSDDFPSCFSVEDVVEDGQEHHYQPIAGPMGWIKRQMDLGIGPRDILACMAPCAQIPPDVEDGTLWKIVIDILTEPTPRHKLDNVNTIDDVVDLLQRSRNIIVLTGAGVSVSCGIPDFRSRDGIYARLSAEYPDLPDPQAMFDISYFYNNPRPFFKFAKEIYPGQFKPSLSHRFIHQLESNQQLLRNYSQNIDTLEQVAGIRRVLQCHGSFSTASCTNCAYKVSSDVIKEDIFNQVIPLCPKCRQDKDTFAVMKPDIVFFGESLPADFYEGLENDSEKADLLIVVGSSLKVRPVALIPSHIPPEIPQILINREPLRHMTFDVELLGDCDAIIAELCERLGKPWIHILQDFEVPPVDSTVLSRAQTPLHNTSSPAVDTTVDDKAVDHAYKNIVLENCKNRELSSSINATELPETKQRDSLCKTDTDSPGAENYDVTEDEASSKTSGRTHPAVHNSPPQICHDNINEPPRFIFMPPSRFVFYGAEIMDSPLPSPDARQLTSLHHSSSGSSLEGENEGERDSVSPANTEGSYCSSDSVSEGSDLEKIRASGGVGMAFITGGLSNYTCESEESSVMSFTDVAAGEAKDGAAVDFRGSGELLTNTATQQSVCETDTGEDRGNEATDVSAGNETSTKLLLSTPAEPALDAKKLATGCIPAAGGIMKDEIAEEAMPCNEVTNQVRATPADNHPRALAPASKRDSVEEDTSSLKNSSEGCRASTGDDDIEISENTAAAQVTENDTYTNSRGTKVTGTKPAASPTNQAEFTAALDSDQSQNSKQYNVDTNCL